MNGDSKDFFKVYFAGELFTHKDLLGNAMLAEALYACSGGKFRCLLPQNLEQRKFQPKRIRDETYWDCSNATSHCLTTTAKSSTAEQLWNSCSQNSLTFRRS